MKFTKLDLLGVYLIELEALRDERGYFARTFCAREFAEQGLDATISQCSTSFNAKRGTVRGMHYQAVPHEETKVVRCTAGSIYDVIIDIRPESPTFAQWRGVELSGDNRRMLYIPPGFAHGFQTLRDNSEVFYQISVDYAPSSARGVLWNDPGVGIAWPITKDVVVSERDAAFRGVRE